MTESLKNTAPACPPDVPPEIAAEFDRLLEMMDGRATPADTITLLMLATSWTTWRRATAEIHRLGNVVMSGGMAVPNPSLSIAHQAHGQIVKLAKELCLTAASRKQLQAEADYDD